MIGGVLGKTAENDTPNSARRRGQFSGNGSDGDARGAIRRKTIDARRDCGKRERRKAMSCSEIERGAVTRRQQFLLAMRPTTPHRADSVDHMLRWQPITAGDLCFAGRAAAQLLALDAQLGTGRAMNGTIDAATAQ